ncbi:putative ribosomal protein S4e [Helianthus anomalus]
MCVSLKLYIVLVFQFLYYTEPACGICCFLIFKLCKVRSVQFGSKGIPYINTYDGRSIRYPDPPIKANDTIKLDLESNKIVNFIKFDDGNIVMVTGGRNTGRVGILKNRVKGY